MQECKEQVELSCNPRQEKEGILRYSPSRVIDRPFVFGIIDLDASKVLEGPLFSALIQEKEWIK